MNPLVQFLEDVIGPAQKGSKGNYKFLCPFSGCQGRLSHTNGEHKLEVDVETIEEEGKQINRWACWSCGGRGLSIYSLLKALKAPAHRFDELKEIIKYTDTYTTDHSKPVFRGLLPKEYKSLEGRLPRTELKLRQAKAYLKKRGITEDDIIKYQIGYCEDGEFGGRVIIPSYDATGKINYFGARTIFEDVKPKYKNPECSRDIIPFELFLNIEEPVIICEGMLDAIAIKRNAIPLLDKELQEALMKKLISSKCKKIYLSLDPDALKQMIKYAEKFMNEGKQVFTVDFSSYKTEDGEKVDPSKMGFVEFTKMIQKATRLTPSKLMKIKINML